MSELEAMGVVVKRSVQTDSTSVNGLELSSRETTKLHLTLPRDSGIIASFAPESMGKKLVKLFKKELQTGDQAFDDAIYIATDTTEATAALLADAPLRELIALYVQTGGPIAIRGATLEVVLAGDQDVEDPGVVRIARAVLGLGGTSQPRA